VSIVDGSRHDGVLCRRAATLDTLTTVDISTHDIVGPVAVPPPVLQILIALAERERHGYAIMQDVAARTDGKVRLGPGTLYGSIKRMLLDGLIEEIDERPDDDSDDVRRRYYRITPQGRRVAIEEIARLAKLVRQARASGLVPKTS
jgi:DNA-binding PadR family transcriptional regulator